MEKEAGKRSSRHRHLRETKHPCTKGKNPTLATMENKNVPILSLVSKAITEKSTRREKANDLTRFRVRHNGQREEARAPNLLTEVRAMPRNSRSLIDHPAMHIKNTAAKEEAAQILVSRVY